MEGYRELAVAIVAVELFAVVGETALSPRAPTSSSGKVMKKRHPNVVPKKAPSTDWNLLFGGVYMSRQLGQ